MNDATHLIHVLAAHAYPAFAGGIKMFSIVVIT
jgi:hypothetical protein